MMSDILPYYRKMLYCLEDIVEFLLRLFLNSDDSHFYLFQNEKTKMSLSLSSDKLKAPVNFIDKARQVRV